MQKLIGNGYWTIAYKNWRNVTATRKITINDVVVGNNSPYHPDTQLLLKVYDHDRQAERIYAATDIHEWISFTPEK